MTHTPPARLVFIQLPLPLTLELWEGSLEAVTLLDNMQYILERVLFMLEHTRLGSGELTLFFKHGKAVGHEYRHKGY